MATVITVVEAAACHYCADAALSELTREFRVVVERVAADSDTGHAMITQHRPGMFPLVLVDGGFFSAGRLPRGKLRALLVGRAAVGGRL
jgi:hypothetical protein